MFPFISKIILNARLKKNESLHQKSFLPWDKIDKIALIIQQDDNINKSAIDNFTASTKKFVEVFYLEIKSKEASFNDWICFSKKDSSLLKLPNNKVESLLAEKKFDLVICACRDEDVYATAILTGLKAPFKCAANTKFKEADMVITPSDPQNLIAYLNDTVRYLKMIKE